MKRNSFDQAPNLPYTYGISHFEQSKFADHNETIWAAGCRCKRKIVILSQTYFWQFVKNFSSFFLLRRRSGSERRQV